MNIQKKSNDGIGWIEDDDDGWVTIEELPLSFTIWSKIPIEVKWVKKDEGLQIYNDTIL